jgi:hypothetical protein
LSLKVNDTLLIPFVQVADESEAQRLLAELITEHATPLIKAIIRRKLQSYTTRAHAQEIEDIQSAAALQLLTRLRACQEEPERLPVTDFRGCVIGIAQHVCYDHLRRKFPQRHALKSRLRYLLTHQAGLALWEDAEQELLCGYAAWQTRKAARAPQAEIMRLRENLSLLRLEQAPAPATTLELSLAVFNFIGQPVALDELTEVIAALQGVKDQTVSLDEEPEAGAPSVAKRLVSPAVSAETRAVQRDSLARLWAEICELPIKQRSALLLNLKDASGNGLLKLLPQTGAATLAQIARALEMSEIELAQLWEELPLEDNIIAARLKLTRQQIINLRKSARERLTRRMKGGW